jgi:HEAT repeat protein
LKERVEDENESDTIWDSDAKAKTVWNKVADAASKLLEGQPPARLRERALDTWEPKELRNAASLALGRMAGDEQFTLLLEMLDDSTKEIRAGAALALGETGRKEAVQPLMDKLENDGEEIVRRDSAKGLAKLADPASEQALIKAFEEDAKESVRVESAIALGNIKGGDGIAALIKTLQDKTVGKKIRWNTANALGTTGSEEAVPALKAALEDDIGDIHFQAAEALRKITGENFGYER